MGSMGLGGWVVGLVVKGFALTPPKHPKCSQPNVKRGYFSPLSLANFSVGLFFRFVDVFFPWFFNGIYLNES